ncbi:MAG TPA: hypothetical protein VGL60_03025 [Acidimicrobiales bacterium]|jgi:hypothetical protein
MIADLYEREAEAVAGESRQVTSSSLVARWRIVAMDLWAHEDVDLVAPGFIEFEPDRMGSLGFIAVQGRIAWRDAPRDGRPGGEFSWEGFDEGDHTTGWGWVAVEDDGTLRGHLFFHLGDDSGFRAERTGETP